MVESSYPMLTPEEALERVLAHVQPLPPVSLALDDALGQVLAAEVRAVENMPPFPSSAMDGYAVVAADQTPEREVLGEQDAGYVYAPAVRPGTAVRIMTGAPLPSGADAVIPVEYAQETGQRVRFTRTFPPKAHVRPVGQDLAVGDLVLKPGMVLGAAEIGLLATMGQVRVPVYPRPRVAVMATGDELVPAESAPGLGQIRDSNSHALAAAVRRFGGVPISLGIIRDTEESLRAAFGDALARADVLVTSGGVSMGRRDLIKPILEEQGQVIFGRLSQKPGKPTTFALIQGRPVFGLPGFPVSSLVSAELYLRPALRKMAGFPAWKHSEITVRLAHDICHEADRMEFQRVVVTWEAGQAWARNTGDQVSGRLLSLVGANALLKLPQGVSDFHRGDEAQALWIAGDE